MQKRIFDYTAEDFRLADREQLVTSIRNSEGRTIMAENVVSIDPPIDVVSGAEILAAFGADMITLNCFDVMNPKIRVLGDDPEHNMTVAEVKAATGRLIGCNLEPIPAGVKHLEVGRTVTKETVEQAIELGLDYVMLTGNPGNCVSQETILDAISLVRNVSKDIMVIAGKMHAGGVGNDYNLGIVPHFAEAGADIMMFPAPYTTPGVYPELAREMMSAVHETNMLGMLAIGTSQEGACETYIERLAMDCKAAGADIVHIGDGGNAGIAPPENLMRLGVTLRGRRHQYKRMANRR
ncbi:dihydrodipicolinate synthase [Photobacterium jeanii]|uniref:Dihydrodipicolinate synthase n=1 Tax=Photobacterium jeanii TaxID=858640 RepID=A0A178K7E7_9GAMM|nr:dihydrodipicolinate synthase [Photobacterium jeanii]OAN13057.1 dihydrodipicolinate synthase [Photobacterium jeanii]PST89206.1 dihydrodipicolinate synthase [Photobacterium jeanii]